jgi:hypothetical protein
MMDTVHGTDEMEFAKWMFKKWMLEFEKIPEVR